MTAMDTTASRVRVMALEALRADEQAREDAREAERQKEREKVEQAMREATEAFQQMLKQRVHVEDDSDWPNPHPLTEWFKTFEWEVLGWATARQVDRGSDSDKIVKWVVREPGVEGGLVFWVAIDDRELRVAERYGTTWRASHQVFRSLLDVGRYFDDLEKPKGEAAG